MSSAPSGVPVIPRIQDRSRLPLSFTQERLWLLDRLEPGLAVENRRLAFRIEGPLDKAALRAALDAVTARHEVLRSRFPGPLPDAGVELIDTRQMPGLRVEDLTVLAPEQRLAEGRRRLGAEVTRPFDLARGPLARALLLRVAAEEHWLVATQHHIVSDGWSDAVFWRELSAGYDALRQGRSPGFEELPLQYGDYAAWQRARLTPDLLRTESAFWRGQLGGAAASLELAFDRPRSARQGHAGGERRLELPRAAFDQVERLGRSRNATPFMTVLTAFGALLCRYSGEQCVVVGVPVAGRPRRELERLVGPFTSHLAVKLDLAGDPPFEDALHRVRRSVLAALARPEIPFAAVAEARRARLGQDHAPVFQVALNWRSFEPPAFSPAGLTTSRLELERQYSRLDLTLEARTAPDGAELLAEYSSELFDPATIDGLLGHLARLLSHAAAAPRARVSELRLLAEEERRLLVSGFHGPAALRSGSQRIEELFVEQARRSPDAVAARCASREVTYAQLLDLSWSVAASLLARGIGPGFRVGVYHEHSLEMLAGILGVLRSGAAFVPLDPAYPEERLRFVAADAKLAAVLADAALPYAALQPIPRLLHEELAAARGPAAAPVVQGDGQDAAYVFYTSGSTGRPKGVVTPHAACVNFLRGITSLLGFGPGDVFAASTPLSFDPAILELLLPLALGARVEILERSLLRDGGALSRVLHERGVSVFQTSPAVYHLLLESGWSGAPHLELLCGGEPLTPALADRLARGGRELWNLYGPTETTVYCTGERWAGEPVCVGRPLENVRSYVLDPHGEPVPLGVFGELHVGGAGLAVGYLNQPELTAERFAPDGFSSVPGARRYRTGDRARFRRDGRVELRGRLDDQFKVRGVRIEPGEVEGALQRLPQVAHAAVIGECGGPDARLVAYVVPRRGHLVEPARLRRELARLLPDVMVPGRFVALDALPLTPTGKLDRQRLPLTPPQPERPEHVAPRTEIETTLATFFEDVLGVAPLGVNDDFFELGGQSLMAVRLFNRIEAVLGVAMPLSAILEAPTVASLAVLLRSQRARRRQATLVRLKPGGVPLFFVHGFGGGVLIYRPLAQALGPETAAYALQEPRYDGPPRLLPDMAAEYIGALRRVQPRGPYRLAGLSFGGLIAFEMARQLAAAGEDVPFLALFDTWGPGYPRFPWAGPRLVAHLKAWGQLSGEARAEYLSTRLAAIPVVVRRRATRGLRRLARLFGRPVPRRVRAAEGALLSAMREYLEQVPSPYPGPVELFRAREQPVGCRHDPTNGWQALAPRLETHEVPGGHDSLLREPRVHAWSALFRARLEAATDAGACQPVRSSQSST